MTIAVDRPVLAIDVGSSRVKLGWFPLPGDCTGKSTTPSLDIAPPRLPVPDEVCRIEHRGADDAEWTGAVARWLDELPLTDATECVIASVHAAAASTLDRLLAARSWAQVAVLTTSDLHLPVRTSEPHRVGIDRLLGAVAANCLRQPHHPAIVIDMGTATTVNLIATDGAFEGGAILAGPVTALTALHAATAKLPLLGADALTNPPPVVGKSTAQAMAAGAYWGAVGAIGEIVRRVAEQCDQPPDLFLTGGGSAEVAPYVKLNAKLARHVPNLVLGAIRLAADRLQPS